MEIKHPSKYSDSFIPIFAELLKGCKNVLDPFGGVGKLSCIKNYGFTGSVICNEIEPEWTKILSYNVDEWHIGDAEHMQWATSNMFHAICMSPTYGNRMADHFNAKDNSKRITYKSFLGRSLNEQNTGRMQWGKNYRDKHIRIYKECRRVVKPGGLIIINVSDHIRKGKQIGVVNWHKQTLIDMRMKLNSEIKVKTSRMGFGQNGKCRVGYEIIMSFLVNKSYEM